MEKKKSGVVYIVGTQTVSIWNIKYCTTSRVRALKAWNKLRIRLLKRKIKECKEREAKYKGKKKNETLRGQIRVHRETDPSKHQGCYPYDDLFFLREKLS